MKTNAEIGMVNPSTDELLTKVDSREATASDR